MEIDQIVGFIDHFPGDQERSALGLRAVLFSGVEAVHAFVIDGIDVRDFLFEGSDIDERKNDHGAGNLCWVEAAD